SSLDTVYRMFIPSWSFVKCRHIYAVSSLMDTAYRMSDQYSSNHCIMTMSREEGDKRAPGLQALIVAEPLILSDEDRVGPNKDDVLGRCMLPLQYVDRRLDHKAIKTRRFNLEKHGMAVEGEKKKEVKFASNIHMKYINPIKGP
ncbi:hypothetical protein Tco_0684732, partial [Tanacetum coccineum]